MRTKPWDMHTFPTDRPVWARLKTSNAGFSMITTHGLEGVCFVIPDKNNKPAVVGMTWGEFFATCVQKDGQPCGVKV